MKNHADAIRILLALGPMSSRQLIEKTELSQPTLSRALAAMGDEVVRIGAARSIRYALRDSLNGQSAVPIFRVSQQGTIDMLGTLIPVRPSGFVMVSPAGATAHTEGLPWWLFDMRPQGYLGRAYAAKHAATLGLESNPEYWSDAAIIRALSTFGHDAVGNLLIGSTARERFINTPTPLTVNRKQDFPLLAEAAATGDAPGSSAGGEQPKFCTYSERGHVLVKFTAAEQNSITERWRDLLLAEHLALRLLDVESQIYDISGRRFLELPRFDRIGELGRVGLISLRALDAEFVGNVRAPWPSIVARLAAMKHVDKDAVLGAAQRWAFGTLIGNTDMHAGNLSFLNAQGRPYALAPAYDMLPMGFSPRSDGTLPHQLPAATLHESVPAAAWRHALQLAHQYCQSLQATDGFSEHFRPCIQAIAQRVEDASERIARLG